MESRTEAPAAHSASAGRTETNLPEIAFAIHPTDRTPIVLRRGELGFYPPSFRPDGSQSSAAYVADMNARLGVTPAQREAMLAGSMFGFDCPAADPASYNTDGTPKTNSRRARSKPAAAPAAPRATRDAGPWWVDYVSTTRAQIVNYQNGPVIATLDAEGLIARERLRGNAALIAAAPDLLAALRVIANCVADSEGGVTLGEYEQRIVREAIAKAVQP